MDVFDEHHVDCKVSSSNVRKYEGEPTGMRDKCLVDRGCNAGYQNLNICVNTPSRN
jgi:hypothetical protein